MKIANRKLESMACVVLEVSPGENSENKDAYMFECFWTKKPDIYGYQIGYRVFKNGALAYKGLTSGCGYCKESHAFGEFLRYLNGGEYTPCGGKVGYFLGRYYKSENHYKCTKNELFKAVGVKK